MSELDHDIPGLIAAEPDGDKIARACAVSPLCEAGNFRVPEDVPWVPEVTHFPKAATDDRWTP